MVQLETTLDALGLLERHENKFKVHEIAGYVYPPNLFGQLPGFVEQSKRLTFTELEILSKRVVVFRQPTDQVKCIDVNHLKSNPKQSFLPEKAITIVSKQNKKVSGVLSVWVSVSGCEPGDFEFHFNRPGFDSSLSVNRHQFVMLSSREGKLRVETITKDALLLFVKHLA